MGCAHWKMPHHTAVRGQTHLMLASPLVSTFLFSFFCISLLIHLYGLVSFTLPSGHDDEVLDVSFDTTGQHLVTGSADGMTSYNHYFLSFFDLFLL